MPRAKRRKPRRGSMHFLERLLRCKAGVAGLPQLHPRRPPRQLARLAAARDANLAFDRVVVEAAVVLIPRAIQLGGKLDRFAREPGTIEARAGAAGAQRPLQE